MRRRAHIHFSWLAAFAFLSLSGTALGGKLVSPSSLSANGVSTNQISLTWADPNDSETGYLIERSLTSSSGFLRIGSTPKNATSFQDSGLAPGTYFYRARAAGKGNNTSPYSNVASGSTLGAAPPPTATWTPTAPPPTATRTPTAPPPTATRTPTAPPPTATRTPTSAPPAVTATPVPATPTPTRTPTAAPPAATATPLPATPTPTRTPTAPPPTATATPLPATPTPTRTPTLPPPTPVPTATPTPVPPAASWTKWYAGGGSFGDSGKSVVVDSTGNVAVAGQFQGIVDFGTGLITSFTNPTSGPTMDAFVAKYSSSGAPFWSRGLGGNATDAATGVAVDSGGNVVVTGFQGSSQVDYGAGTLGTRGSNDVFVAKYSSTTGDHVWSKTVGGTGPDRSGAVAVDSGGNVFLTGYMSVSSSGVDFGGGALFSAGGPDVFLVKYSSGGAHVWSKRFGGAGTDMGMAVGTDSLGNVVVVGSFDGTIDFGGGPLTTAGGRDLFAARFSPAGQHLWSKRFGGTSNEDVRGVAVDGAGDVFLTGQFLGSINFGGPTLTSAGFEDIFLAKLSGVSGGHVWSKRLGSSSAPDAGYGVAVDGAGNVAITGFFAGLVDFGGGGIMAQVYDIFVAKYSSTGAYLSARRFGDPPGLYDSQYGDGIAMSSAGTIYVSGHFMGTLDFGAAGCTTSLFAGGSDAYFANVGP